MTGKQPVSNVQWVDRATIVPNDYNPNKQPPPEHRLLKVSILEDGWTQPIVIFDDGSGGKPIIIDGEHRWLASKDKDIFGLTGGKVPVVKVSGDIAHRMMSTIRHNRARGEHHILPMADIVISLLQIGIDKEKIQFLLQMEDEEVERLAETAGLPEVVSRGHAAFNKGWVPE